MGKLYGEQRGCLQHCRRPCLSTPISKSAAMRDGCSSSASRWLAIALAGPLLYGQTAAVAAQQNELQRMTAELSRVTLVDDRKE